MSGSNPITWEVDGAPFSPGQFVLVVQSIDRDVFDVSEFVGRFGVVKYLEYNCGCGQNYPDDPMIGVKFRDGSVQEFWSEELQSVTP